MEHVREPRHPDVRHEARGAPMGREHASLLSAGESRGVERSVMSRGMLRWAKALIVPCAPTSDRLAGRAGYIEVRWRAPGSKSRKLRQIPLRPAFHVQLQRHTFACSWVDRGGSLAALQHLLGHSSITTTQRHGRISDSMVKAERCAWDL